MWNLWSSMTLLPVNWDGQCLIFSMLDWHVKSMFTLTQGTFRGCYCSFNKLIQLAQVENFQATRVADLIRILPGILNYWQSNVFTTKGASGAIVLRFWLVCYSFPKERSCATNLGCLLFSQCFRAGVFSSLSPPRSFDLPRFLLFVGVSTCHSHEQSFFFKSRWSVKLLHASC